MSNVKQSSSFIVLHVFVFVFVFSLFPALSVERTIFSPIEFWPPCQIRVDQRCQDLILEFLFCFIVVYGCASTILFLSS